MKLTLYQQSIGQNIHSNKNFLVQGYRLEVKMSRKTLKRIPSMFKLRFNTDGMPPPYNNNEKEEYRFPAESMKRIDYVLMYKKHDVEPETGSRAEK